MTAFDAPRRSDPGGGSFRRAAAAAAAQPAVVLVAVIGGASVLIVAIALWMVFRAVSAQVWEMAAGTTISVFVDPLATRADSMALGARLTEQPVVLDVVLRTKEQALAAFDKAVLPALSEAQNPLPDVWIVKLRLPDPAANRPSLAAYFSTTVASLSALPGVDSTRTDLAWVTTIDGWIDRIERYRDRVAATGAGLSFVALLAISFMAGRAIQTPNAGRADAANLPALACYGFFLGLLSVAIASGVRWVALDVLPADAPAGWRPILAHAALLDNRMFAMLCAGAVVASVLGAAAGYRRDSHEASYSKRHEH